MSIDVSITQKGLIKRALPFHVILGDDLSYGAFDGLRLSPGDRDEREFIAYQADHIGRGFSVEWKQGEKENVSLRLLTPTSSEELHDFFTCIKRIGEYWKCGIEVDGISTTLTSFMNQFEDMVDFNLRTMDNMMQELLDGKAEEYTLFCAIWPLILGKEEARRLIDSKSLDAFRNYMHEKQCIDAYYASPNFFKDDLGCLGVYVLSENVRSIFPLRPNVPFGITDPATGKGLEVSRWNLYLYSSTRDGEIGVIPYENFISRLPKDKVEYYDAGNILIENLTLTEMEALLI